jgi:chromosome segregation ATPase
MSRLGRAPNIQAIDESYSALIAAKHFDHESTISFPLIAPDAAVVRVRSEAIANDERIALLRQQIEEGNAQSTQLHELFLSLNAFLHRNVQKIQNIKSSLSDPQFKLQAFNELLRDHNSLLTEQLSSLPESESQDMSELTTRISSLRSQIQREKLSHPELTSRRDELERVKRKSRFYKREYDQLNEFVRKELDFEREEDDAAVDGLKQAISTLSKELESQRSARNQNHANDCACLFRQIDAARKTLDERNTTLIALEATKCQSTVAIDFQTAKIEFLVKELEILRSMTRG